MGLIDMTYISMTIDPVIFASVQIAFSLILVISGYHKLAEMTQFQGILIGYRLLPDAWVACAAVVIAAVEVGAGALLLFNSTVNLGILVSLLYTGLASLAVMINLLRGNVDIDCGCGNLSSASVLSNASKLTWAIPMRNGVMMTLLASLLLGKNTRAVLWVDYLSICCASISLLALYYLFDLLSSNKSVLAKLRKHP